MYINWGISDSIFYKVIGNYSGFFDNLLDGIGFYQDSTSSDFPLLFLLYSKPKNSLVAWPISRLKYKEIWFQIDVNNKHYELHLERINN